jgi:hypothetical protein
MVPVAWARYREPNPANVRTVLWVKNEYVILHDDLRIDPAIPSFWHAQVVAESETGSASVGEGYRFKGRFGTDLQIVLPGQAIVAEQIERLSPLEYPADRKEKFAMRHLQLTGAPGVDHYTAVIRPLSPGQTPVQTAEVKNRAGKPCGVKVTGNAGNESGFINDVILLGRDAFAYQEGDVRFEGRYGTVIRRADSRQLALIAGSVLEADDTRIESNGPAVFVTLTATGTEIVSEGEGSVTVTRHGKPQTLAVKGRVEASLTA